MYLLETDPSWISVSSCVQLHILYVSVQNILLAVTQLVLYAVICLFAWRGVKHSPVLSSHQGVVLSAGVFWIAWEDLCQYYDVIYLSWNPALFRESSCIHR